MTARRATLKLGTLGVLCIFVLGVSARVSQKTPTYKGLPQDWSSHRVIFPLNSLAKHPGLINSEPRVMLQLLRLAKAGLRPVRPVTSPALAPSTTGVDWSVSTVRGKVPFGQFPAEFTLNPASPSCSSDFAVFALGNTTGTTGGQATIIGFNNLYVNSSGTGFCPLTSPFNIFAYNTSTLTGGVIRTSPILSLDGKKIAFVESVGGATPTSVLHVLTYAVNVGASCANGCAAGASVAPGVGNTAKMVTVTYANANNTRSSPWIDYNTDTIYVGANDGAVHKITGVFTTTTPTVVNGGGWPVTVNNKVPLTGPVQDTVTGNIFVGDNRGILHSFSYLTPGTVSNLVVGVTATGSLLDTPLVDAPDGVVFVTTSNNGTGAAIVEARTSNLAKLTSVSLGNGSIGNGGNTIALYDGDVDNAFFTNGPASGHMFACGTGPADFTPYLYRFPFNASVVIQPASSATQIVNSTTARCSPLTGFFNSNINGGTDFFFWGVTDTCVNASGCVMSVANGITFQRTAETGGTSGIIVDNDTTQPDTSNIYFSNESNPLAAKQVTQSALQ